MPSKSSKALITALICLALPMAALAEGPGSSWLEASLDAPDTVQQAGQQAGQQGSTQAQPAETRPAESLPIHMDKDLAREHELFSNFAHSQVQRMNANILGGRHHMQVYKGSDGLYHASYKAIDLPGVVCQVRRSTSNPRFYVGHLIYKEQIMESVAPSADACRRGSFQPVSEKTSRLIYTSQPGGGWH